MELTCSPQIPQIFVRGTNIGGFNSSSHRPGLRDLLENGKLLKALNEASDVDAKAILESNSVSEGSVHCSQIKQESADGFGSLQQVYRESSRHRENSDTTNQVKIRQN